MQHRIELDSQETDIDIVFPGGQVMQIQYRLMSPSIDICLPTECRVTNWEGDDMQPANEVCRAPHVRLAKQIVIDLNPKWGEKKGKVKT